jgi:signal transduction histidine kinase
MTRKLLHKTQKTYLIYSIITFLIVSPIFYFITEKLYLDDTDETLLINKQRFNKQILPNFKIRDIDIWNTYNPNNQILESQPLKKDSIFNTLIYSDLEQENVPYRALYTPILIENKPFLYTERISLIESEDLLISIAILFIILIGLLLLGILVITNLISKRLWQPFYKLINQIENFEMDKDIVPSFGYSNIEEFNRLNNSVEKLISKNIAIYKNQREFIDNAAHELQTPLAVFRSKLDLLIQRDDITQGQVEIINSVTENINKLIKLNKNLLILSKIDRHLHFEVEEFSLKEVLEKQVEFFNAQANSKQINFILKVDKDRILNTNKNLTEILFSNLLLNAMQHNIENGSVIIELNKKNITISNTSNTPKISKENLFNQFAKTNNNQQGNGLGLSIVKKIAILHKWQISYSFFENTHKFSIQF